MNSNLPYKLNWIDLSHLGYQEACAIGSLPGFNHRFISRNFENDKRVILSGGIQHAFLMCEERELTRFGGRSLSMALSQDGIEVYYFPCEYGYYLDIGQTMDMIRMIFSILEKGEKCIIISREGFGRPCVIGAAMLLHTMDNLTHDAVYDIMKKQYGTRAIQTVKQYNFLVDFRTLRDEYYANQNGTEMERCISR